ncbi:uncharacterized protein LOC124926990 [Impatiens glandulifera]|uniref:uncharacterized protein LOC124926990 n=1 Tax=Impatiens glandulifera TaxID=253017 RepID=UPI001FB0C819|nr:uncharacterized protein LOC124926990 [Impatiens glandulifera]
MITNPCTNLSCFFCLINEPDPSTRRTSISNYLKEIPLLNDQQHILVLSSLWNIAMTKPDDPEFPSLGIFKCMSSFIRKGLNNKKWLSTGQNIYIPYYAAHIIGSYTMNKPEFAKTCIESGVIPPLIDLMRGQMSWVEQRVSVRALGHILSFDSTFGTVVEYEEELVGLAMRLASTCLETVYADFVSKRLEYHRDLLTRGVGGREIEDRKVEEWASQLQCWSLYILNTFAMKERSINVMCDKVFLKELCGMWGGLVNHSSPCGIGLLRILCYSKIGRERISESLEVVASLCNMSRSSDDWQYMAIDCILLLLNDPITRYKVIDHTASCLVDLVELRTLGDRSHVGDLIAKTLFLLDGKIETIDEVWSLVERRKKERLLSCESVEEMRVLAGLTKQQGNNSFWEGDIEESLLKYSEGLKICPLKFRKDRLVLYSNRAQCHLLLGDPDAAISDATRALCLSKPVNSHGKSLWRRSQAYDAKGLSKESLMDCIAFVNVCMRSEKMKNIKIPYYAARMITKQMDSIWLFATAHSKALGRYTTSRLFDDECESSKKHDTKIVMGNKGFTSNLSTIMEEPLFGNRRLTRRRRMSL